MEASDEKPTLCGHVHEKWLRQDPGAVLREYKHHKQSEPRTIKQSILNVGVDQHRFWPVSEVQVLELFKDAAALPSRTPLPSESPKPMKV